MIPEELLKAVEQEGLSVVERGAGHFQIRGGVLLVNYYPGSKKRSAYIEGMVKAHHYVTPKQAVQLALNPRGIPTKQKRRKTYVNIKMRLYRETDVCYRCGKPIIVFEDATLEHKVPLSQGGLDNINNMALAHEKCNWLHGNRMPEKKQYSIYEDQWDHPLDKEQ